MAQDNCDGILLCQRKYDDDDDEVDDDYDDDVVVVKAVSGIYASWQRLWVRGCTGRPTLDWFGSTTFGILFIIIQNISNASSSSNTGITSNTIISGNTGNTRQFIFLGYCIYLSFLSF